MGAGRGTSLASLLAGTAAARLVSGLLLERHCVCRAQPGALGRGGDERVAPGLKVAGGRVCRRP